MTSRAACESVPLPPKVPRKQADFEDSELKKPSICRSGALALFLHQRVEQAKTERTGELVQKEEKLKVEWDPYDSLQYFITGRARRRRE